MGIPAGIDPQDYYFPDNICAECGSWSAKIVEPVELCPECLGEKYEEENQP